MKSKYLFGGILMGGFIGTLITYFVTVIKPAEKIKKEAVTKDKTKNWNWPDSLDALQAAPAFHKLVFETEELRILEVTLNPGELDPIHTHKGKSIVWVVMTAPIVYNTYGMGLNNKLTLVKKDTLVIKAEELNEANWENPEPPHSVENIGKDIFKLYRIEYKN